MKKFLVIIAVLALTVVSSVAMAEVTVSGSIDIRNLTYNNINDFNSDTQTPVGTTQDRNRTTQERIRINIDAKHENVKGRFTLENDWYVWGSATNGFGGTSVESKSGAFTVREGWIDFTIPGAGPAHVKVGHQFLQLGNGWFFRSGKYGSDAWLVGLPGKNTVAFVNVKAMEVNANTNDDVDAYVLLDNLKLSDSQTVGVYIAHVNDRMGTIAGNELALNTLGLWFNGKLGPINLQAELNLQSGKAKQGISATQDLKFSGNQLVVQATMPMDALTLSATAAMGSGNEAAAADTENEGILVLLDKDPHYTFVYEYFATTACNNALAGATPKNTGFCNTTALSLGADFAVSKSLTLGASAWFLKANEKVNMAGGALDSDLGTEIDVKVNWKLYDQLSWNWTAGMLMPGAAYENAAGQADDVTAIQGVLSYKF